MTLFETEQPRGKRSPVRGKELQEAIVKEARRQGWLVAHFFMVETKNRGWVTPAGKDGKGFPDLFLARDRPLMIEVKGDGDSMKPDQLKWQAAAKMAGIEHVVATPKLWADGTIDEILRRRSD